MNKFFIRIVGLILIPCLVTGPVSAGGLEALFHDRPVQTSQIIPQYRFQEAALTLALEYVRPWHAKSAAKRYASAGALLALTSAAAYDHPKFVLSWIALMSAVIANAWIPQKDSAWLLEKLRPWSRELAFLLKDAEHFDRMVITNSGIRELAGTWGNAMDSLWNDEEAQETTLASVLRDILNDIHLHGYYLRDITIENALSADQIVLEILNAIQPAPAPRVSLNRRGKLKFAAGTSTERVHPERVVACLKRHPVSEWTWEAARAWWIAHRDTLRGETGVPDLMLTDVSGALLAAKKTRLLADAVIVAERGPALDFALGHETELSRWLGQVAPEPGRFSPSSSRELTDFLTGELERHLPGRPWRLLIEELRHVPYGKRIIDAWLAPPRAQAPNPGRPSTRRPASKPGIAKTAGLLAAGALQAPLWLELFGRLDAWIWSAEAASSSLFSGISFLPLSGTAAVFLAGSVAGYLLAGIPDGPPYPERLPVPFPTGRELSRLTKLATSRARYFVKQEAPGRAVLILNDLLKGQKESAPDDPSRIMVYNSLAYAQAASLQFLKALQTAREGLDLLLSSPVYAPENKGRLSRTHGIDLDRETILLRYRAAALLRDMGLYRDAIGFLRSGQDGALRADLAGDALARGLFNDLVRQRADVDVGRPIALALRLGIERRFDEAENLLRYVADRLGPDDALRLPLMNKLSGIYRKQGNCPKALQTLEQAGETLKRLRATPGFHAGSSEAAYLETQEAHLLVSRARVYFDMGDSERSVSAVSPDGGRTLRPVMRHYAGSDGLLKSLRSYRDPAMRIDRNRLALASQAMKNGRFDHAQRLLQGESDKSGSPFDEANLQNHWGQFYRLRGEWDNALAHLARARSILRREIDARGAQLNDPNNHDGRQILREHAYNTLLTSKVLSGMGRLEDALAEISRDGGTTLIPELRKNPWADEELKSLKRQLGLSRAGPLGLILLPLAGAIAPYLPWLPPAALWTLDAWSSNDPFFAAAALVLAILPPGSDSRAPRPPRRTATRPRGPARRLLLAA